MENAIFRLMYFGIYICTACTFYSNSFYVFWQISTHKKVSMHVRITYHSNAKTFSVGTYIHTQINHSAVSINGKIYFLIPLSAQATTIVQYWS